MRKLEEENKLLRMQFQEAEAKKDEMKNSIQALEILRKQQ